MHFTFSPNVGESVHVTVPFTHTRASTFHLCFTADITLSDYEQYEQTNAKLQLWSDLPADRGAFEWGELDFQPGPTKVPYDISLFESPDYDAPIKTLSLAVSVPLSLASHTFSFTYRLVYPSGEVEWLGAYGQNGSIALDVQTEPGFKPANGWSLSQLGTHLVWSTNGKSADDSYLMKMDPSVWMVWGLGKNKFLKDVKDCSIIFFTPKLRKFALLETFAMTASPGVSTSLSVSGDVSSHGDGSVALYVYDYHISSESFLSTIFEQSDGRNFNIREAGENHLLLASSEHYPANIAFIPLSTIPFKSPCASIRAAVLSNILQTDASSFSLFTPSNGNVHFYNTIQGEEVLTFFVPSSGGEAILSPLHDLFTTTSRDQISILSAYKLQQDSDNRVLPTPPPSPRLKPIAHLSHLKENDKNASLASISDIGITSRRDTPERDHELEEQISPVANQTPKDQQNGFQLFGIRRAIRRAASTVVFSSDAIAQQGEGTASRRSRLVVYINIILYAVWMCVSSLLKRLFGIGRPLAIERGDSSLSSRQSGDGDVGRAGPHRSGERRADERTPLLKGDTGAAGTSTKQSHSKMVTQQPIVSSTSATTNHDSTSSLVIEVAGNEDILFVHRKLVENDSHTLAIEWNGKPIMPTDVRQVARDAELFRITPSLASNEITGKLRFTLAPQ